MAAILVIAHAPLASALLSVARHVYADCAAVLAAVDVGASMSVETAEAQARQAMVDLGGGEVLILTDVFGATPCNVAQRLSDGQNTRVVTGVNVPMLWRTLCYAREPLDSLAARAVAGATQGVMQISSNRPQNQTQTPPTHDSHQSRHQQ